MARVAYDAGELLLRGAAVGIETIATTLDEGNEAAEGKPAKSKSSPFRVWGFYSAALSTPSVFNRVG